MKTAVQTGEKASKPVTTQKAFGSLEYRGFVAVAMTRHLLLDE